MATNEPKPLVPGEEKNDDQLGQLRKELYAREESSTITARNKDLSHLGMHRQALPAAPSTQPAPRLENIMSVRAKRRRKIMWGIGAGVGLLVLLGVAIAGTLWYRVRQSVTSDQIQITLQAPAEFTAGNAITYTATVANTSHVDWQNVEVVFEFPAGFRYLEASQELKQAGKEFSAAIGNLASQGTHTITIQGRLLGEYNQSLLAQAQVEFTPVNFPSGRFDKKALASTVITNVPVDVVVDASEEAQSGERLVATIHVRNTSAAVIEGAYIKLNPAPGMQTAADDQQFSPGFSIIDSAWELGRLEPLAQVERRAVLYAEGNPGDRRPLDIEVGVREGDQSFVQRTQTHLVTITTSALAIEQIYNDSNSTVTVDPEQTVAGVIRYSNIGTTGLKNAVIKVKFEGTGIDPATIKLPTGNYDPTTKTITWTAASVPALATLQPRQEGAVEYEFKILPANSFPTTGENTKNNVLVATATIDSPDIITPTGQLRNLVSDRAVLSVASTLQLDTSAFYDDGRLGLTSAGPTPPRAGEQTTYTVRFRLGSTLNDLGDVQLKAVLPDGVRYTGKNYVTSGQIQFDDRSGELTWTMPKLDGLTGRTKPAEEVHVQVAITPGENQRNQTISFLNKVSAEGTDLFTDKQVTATITQFPTTETAVKDKGTVE